MTPHLRSFPCPLPDEATPFVRELLLEIARRIPASLLSPPRFEPAALRDAGGCVEAGRALLAWLDTITDTVGQRVEELEAVFRSLLQVVRDIDTKLHRAVRETRGWVEEEMAFSRSVHEALQEVETVFEGPSDHTAVLGLLEQVILRIEAKENRDAAEALALSSHFARVQADLEVLRTEISEVESHTRRLHDQSLRDLLTGLWNRRACEARLAEEVARAQRYASPLSLALWDVDHLKQVNDAHGHPLGDLVLQSLAGRMVSLFRRSDFLARCGGGEFAVILPNTTLAQAVAASEKIRTAAMTAPVHSRAGPIWVAVSVGVTTFARGDTAASLLERGDQALYRAKTLGRNRVEAEAQAQSDSGGQEN